MTTDPNIGRLLSNRYQLVELVGKGAMGRVYRAEDVLLGGVIAVKFLAQTLLNSKMRDRFKTEARTCAQLGQKSIHIVRVMDYGINEEDVPFYVMEYLEGENLNEIINSPVLSVPRFLSLTRQICLGLQCAHQGIVVDGKNCPIIHRDIKPSNILVSKDSSLGELVKILDFGIAKLIQEDSGQTSSYMGTLAYSSPEQMEGRDLDARSDIYSMGVMMFEMLAGKMPIQAETHSFGSWYKAHHFQNPRALAATNPSLKLPKALESLIMSCLAKTPDDRPQSIEEILKALEPLDQRFSANRQVSQRLSEVLANKPLVNQAKVPLQPVSITEVCQRAVWPKGKPIAQIVFAQIISNAEQSVPSLWVMLSQQEIENFQRHRLYNKIYRNFLCSMSPHPMLLWITAIYNRLQGAEQGPRWLRCYLDLKTPHGQEVSRLIAEQGKYSILMFALENPASCAHVITVKIHPSQCTLLREWVITSNSWTAAGSSGTTKNILQAEFEKLKPKISVELEADTLSNSFPSLTKED